MLKTGTVDFFYLYPSISHHFHSLLYYRIPYCNSSPSYDMRIVSFTLIQVINSLHPNQVTHQILIRPVDSRPIFSASLFCFVYLYVNDNTSRCDNRCEVFWLGYNPFFVYSDGTIWCRPRQSCCWDVGCIYAWKWAGPKCHKINMRPCGVSHSLPRLNSVLLISVCCHSENNHTSTAGNLSLSARLLWQLLLKSLTRFKMWRNRTMLWCVMAPLILCSDLIQATSTLQITVFSAPKFP